MVRIEHVGNVWLVAVVVPKILWFQQNNLCQIKTKQY